MVGCGAASGCSSEVRKVYYPGLATHPQHELARGNRRSGAMIAFDLGDEGAARRFLNQVKICALAEVWAEWSR